MEDYYWNRVRLCGTMDAAPVFSHENHGRRFYRFYLAVERLSGTVDLLPVLADWNVLDESDAAWGEDVLVEGQIRSFNQPDPSGRRHLILSVYAQTLSPCCEEADNQVELAGALCRDPIYRRTPLGREICDVMLAVNRPYHRTDYIPCILWGRSARAAARLSAGSGLRIAGRLQSRTYTKVLPDGTAVQKTAYEVSAAEAEIAET